MITTSTPELDITIKKETETNEEFSFATPSVKVINLILNYSRNLEIKKSKWISDIELLKS